MKMSIRFPVACLLRFTLGAATALVVTVQPALAQQYPARPVKIVVGYSAGGAVDTVARTLGQSMSTLVHEANIKPD